ncbi:MAG: trypsin-like peptidase domain-containing protein [Moorea sp. SIO3C2]|nr:trypsin-like peptidase domain-containing protein [Moorena sp. SIO3C2]
MVEILANQAMKSLVDPKMFFRDLVRRTNLPQRWAFETAATWTGDVAIDSRRLIDWLDSKGTNPQDKRYTALGAVLTELLQNVGFEDASFIVSLIINYNLYRSQELSEKLMICYQVPDLAGKVEATNSGPDIDWQGPTDDLQLQSFFKPKPNFIDVGFLMQAIQQAASVCRIEIPEQGVMGTGFLVNDNLVLTNYHVLETYYEATIESIARNVVLRFGYFYPDSSGANEGQLFKLASDKPILAYSNTSELDYVLLQVEDKILQSRDLRPAPLEFQALPYEGTDINILQHPDGASMKLTISSNGITGVYKNSGRIQYVTKTAPGSSGSPCFNENWKVVAIHHAQRTKYFGLIQEVSNIPS